MTLIEMWWCLAGVLGAGGLVLLVMIPHHRSLRRRAAAGERVASAAARMRNDIALSGDPGGALRLALEFPRSALPFVSNLLERREDLDRTDEISWAISREFSQPLVVVWVPEERTGVLRVLRPESEPAGEAAWGSLLHALGTELERMGVPTRLRRV